MTARISALCACVLLAGCDISYEVLTLESSDAGMQPSMPSETCKCGEQQVCGGDQCLALSDIAEIATGDKHTCRIYQKQLWCWGDNASRQLGLPADAADLITEPQHVGSRSDWVVVAAGAQHTCALREPGVLRCWGDNSLGQLGSSSARAGDQPRLPVDDFRQLKCAGDNCCALRNGGSLYCWGDNRDGNVGVGRDDASPIDVPTMVGGDKTFLRAFSVGKTHSCAIASDRTLWCWGSNKANQLGVTDLAGASSPIRVTDYSDWLWVAAGGTQTCAIRRGNILYCWGDNSDGQVGIGRVGPDGEVVETAKPVIVTMNHDWVRVAAGDRHACAIKSGQPLFCWGSGDSGQLGLRDPAMVVVQAPTRLAGAQRFRELALGAAFSCGLDVTEPEPRMYCWGANDRGQLGTGDTDPRREPTLVGL